VTGNEGKGDVCANAFDGLVVCGTYAAGLDAEHYLAQLGLRDWNVFENEVIEVFQDSGKHGTSPCVDLNWVCFK
jgi:hypothetical protein